MQYLGPLLVWVCKVSCGLSTGSTQFGPACLWWLNELSIPFATVHLLQQFTSSCNDTFVRISFCYLFCACFATFCFFLQWFANCLVHHTIFASTCNEFANFHNVQTKVKKATMMSKTNCPFHFFMTDNIMTQEVLFVCNEIFNFFLTAKVCSHFWMQWKILKQSAVLIRLTMSSFFVIVMPKNIVLLVPFLNTQPCNNAYQ